MRYLIFSLSLLFMGENAFADALVCNAGAGELSTKISDGQAEVKSESPVLDASLGPSSLFYALEDPARQRRVAFTGSSLAVSPDGALLETGATHVTCRLAPDQLSFAPPAAQDRPDYLACALDEAHFQNGAPISSTRRLIKITSPINSRFPLSVAQEDKAVAYAIRYSSTDPVHGLELTLIDKATGEVAHYVGPARSLQKSFLFGLTLGDRAVSARLLRLGCLWANDPKVLTQ